MSPSLSGFSGNKKRKEGLTHSWEGHCMLRQSLFFCGHWRDMMGQGHRKSLEPILNKSCSRQALTEIPKLTVLGGLSGQFTCKLLVCIHAEHWKNCILSSSFFLPESTLKSPWGAGDLSSHSPVRDKGFSELGRALIRTLGFEHTSDSFNSPALFPENGWSF